MINKLFHRLVRVLFLDMYDILQWNSAKSNFNENKILVMRDQVINDFAERKEHNLVSFNLESKSWFFCSCIGAFWLLYEMIQQNKKNK